MTAPLAPEALDAATLSVLLGSGAGSGPFDPEQELTFEQVEGAAHVWRVRPTPAVPRGQAAPRRRTH